MNMPLEGKDFTTRSLDGEGFLINKCSLPKDLLIADFG